MAELLQLLGDASLAVRIAGVDLVGRVEGCQRLLVRASGEGVGRDQVEQCRSSVGANHAGRAEQADDLPPLKEFEAATPVQGWKAVAHSKITIFSTSFEYLGWGYPGVNQQPGACY